MKLTRLFIEFSKSEQAGGILLVICAVISLLLCNSSLQHDYSNIWHFQSFGQSIEFWINDGMMTLFFLLIGLELEREIYAGELSDIRNSMLPIIAAMGGMIVPAGLYLLFNLASPSRSGAGIPMATDIAFAISVLSLLGSRVPASLKVFLTALAVIDDLGAIIVIAVFYTNQLSWTNLGIAMGIFGFLLVLNRLKVGNLIPYLLGGTLMWYFMLHSGVHATITGVLLAFAIPFGDGKSNSASFALQHFLHKPVAFFVLPLFALANTCVIIGTAELASLAASNGSIGILAGLTIGKPLGIFLFGYMAVAFGISALPKELQWKHIFGVGILGGIGFTMSIFITLLAFDNAEQVNQSKIAILAASFVSAVVGLVWLTTTLEKKVSETG